MDIHYRCMKYQVYYVLCLYDIHVDKYIYFTSDNGAHVLFFAAHQRDGSYLVHCVDVLSVTQVR